MTKWLFLKINVIYMIYHQLTFPHSFVSFRDILLALMACFILKPFLRNSLPSINIFRECNVDVLLSFLPCHSFGDYAAIALANSLGIPSCFIVSASLIDSLDTPLFRLVCTDTYTHLNCSLAHSVDSNVEREMLRALYSRVTTAFSHTHQTRSRA